MSTVSSYFQRNRSSSLGLQNSGPTQAEIANALKPLFTYFDENFAIMNQTLTNAAMITVMSRLWKEVLSTVEALLVPPLSDKPSQQKQLTQQELDVVFKWLEVRSSHHWISLCSWPNSFFLIFSTLLMRIPGSQMAYPLTFSSLQSTMISRT